MHGYINRQKELTIRNHIDSFPCVALLGARQVGKSTLAKKLISTYPDSIYLDLEDPRDLSKLQSPVDFLEANKDKLICLDEIQRLPEVFPILRGYLDRGNRNGQLLVLGSASKDLIQQSSESLAGRISYIEISPFSALEVGDIQKLWLQGGYPSSYQLGESMSFEWRTNYIRTFLERDIPNLGINIPANTLSRFWKMIAHLNASILNVSKLAASMGVSSPTVKSYLDILEGTFITRQLQPYFKNTKKRLIKSPKIYIRDSGLVHCLLGITSFNDLLGHPAIGGSYEAMVIENLLQKYPHYEPSFYRTSNGAEIDLVLEKGTSSIVFEIKSSSTPILSKGFYTSLKDLNPDEAYVIAQIDGTYPINSDISAYSLDVFLKNK